MADELTESALRYHRLPRPGKIEVVPTKPLATQRDLSLAYSPGVAVACNEIVRDPAYLQVGHRSKPAKSITHRAEVVEEGAKLDWLINYLRRPEGPLGVAICYELADGRALAAAARGQG